MKFFDKMFTVFLRPAESGFDQGEAEVHEGRPGTPSPAPRSCRGRWSAPPAIFALRVRGKGDGADDHTGHVERPELT